MVDRETIRIAREIAFVGKIAEVRTRHATGLPDGPQVEMPNAEILVLEKNPKGTAMLFRYTRDGQDAGDTWHQTVEDAKAQASWEYENALGMWVNVPDGTKDALTYAQRLRSSPPRA
jgi:hypothetical protein